MRKYIRIFIALIVVLSFVLLAKNKAAGAANPASGSQASLEQANSPASLQGGSNDDDDCNPHDNRNKDKCKDKDKCKKHDDCGTVKPPDDDIDVCEKGDYSIGGVAVLDVKKLQDRKKKDDCFHAQSKSSEDVQLPQNAGPVLSDEIVLTSVGQGSTIKICFAVPPGTKVKIYMSKENTWKALGTQVKNGVACANVLSSGSFVLGGK